MNAIQAIEQLNIPTNSFVTAIQYTKEHLAGLSQNEYDSMYHRIAGVEFTSKNEQEAYYNFLYLVQTTVREFKNNKELDMDTIIRTANEQANRFLVDYDFSINAGNRVEQVVEMVDGVEVLVNKQVVKKSKSNKDLVKELVEAKENMSKTKNEMVALIMETLKVSKSNAGVYLYNYYKA